MAAQRIQRLTLDLVISAPDSISGRICDASGRGTDFVGWLGLAGALEALSAAPRRGGRG